MPDYANGKIYKISSPNTDKYYIGSTCIDLRTRLLGHNSSYRTRENRNNTYTVYQVLEHGGAIITLLENYPCTNRKDLTKREGHYICDGNCVNTRHEGRDPKLNKKLADRRHQQKNKERLAKYNKEYREKNKEKIRQQRKQYRDTEPIKISKKEYDILYREKNKERIEKYREENKQKTRDRAMRNYYKNTERDRAIIICECGARVQKISYRKHLLTKTHKAFKP
jgi:hypothetical protein